MGPTSASTNSSLSITFTPSKTATKLSSFVSSRGDTEVDPPTWARHSGALDADAEMTWIARLFPNVYFAVPCLSSSLECDLLSSTERTKRKSRSSSSAAVGMHPLLFSTRSSFVRSFDSTRGKPKPLSVQKESAERSSFDREDRSLRRRCRLVYLENKWQEQVHTTEEDGRNPRNEA